MKTLREKCIECESKIGPGINSRPFDSQDLINKMQLRCRSCATNLLYEKSNMDFGHDSGGGNRVIRETKTH